MGELLYGDVTEKILAAAYEIHRELGPGFGEKAYENSLLHELTESGLIVAQQQTYHVSYKGVTVDEYRIDLLVDNKIIVEVKATTEHAKIFEAQLLSYLKTTGFRVGLLLNFGTASLWRKRFVM